MVPQEKPTFIVTNDGEAMELLFNLPGQRAGARGWYMYLRDTMEKGGLKAPFLEHQQFSMRRARSRATVT